MIYIKEIQKHIPKNIINDNFKLANKFNVNSDFIREKIGINRTFYKNEDEDTSDLCVKAFKKLKFNKSNIDCLIVCTQNPDRNGIPHTSAIVHSKLKLNNDCACFDISLGCSGYVYSLSIAKSLMISNNFKNCVIFTCDPYSKILNKKDKNTTLLFSDAATVSVLSNSIKKNKNFYPVDFLFGNDTLNYNSLNNDEKMLSMNGRVIFNFVSNNIPKQINSLLKKNNLSKSEIDYFLFHQGSMAIINHLKEKLKLENHQIISNISKYGNTVSSTIPLLMENLIKIDRKTKIVMCGFGVGLSYASCLLKNY